MADNTNVETPQSVAAPAVTAPVDTTPVSVEATPVVGTEVITPAIEASVETNVLGDAPVKVEDATPDPKPEVKPEVKAEPVKDAPAVETPKDEAVPEGDKPAGAVLPVYEEWKLPEGVNLDKEPMEAFTKLLGEIEMGKFDHAGMQEAGQKLIDLATKSTTDSIERLNDYYVQFHENQKKEWFESFKKDPDMGGSNLDQTVGALREAVEAYGGTAEQISEFRKVMKETGVGNHPAVNRILHNMVQEINKYTTEADNGNGGNNRIVPGQRPAPSKVKDYQRFYGNGS